MTHLGPRGHASYGAFIVHRVSGLMLTLFLPLHFWALGTAIDGEARLQSFVHWAEHPLVKLAEIGLVGLLAAHLAGGLRLLALEFLAWRDNTKTLVAAALGFAVATGLLFALNVAA